MKNDRIFRNGKSGRAYIISDIHTVYIISPYVCRKIHVINSDDFIENLKKRGYSERRQKMINIRTLRKLINNDGLTLKKGQKITYKTGYQVATEGIETTDQREAMNAIKAYKGDCGIWFADGIYYIDKSHRVNTKREALEVGRACKQISVLKWSNMSLVYC